jgi:hypothetical protein
MSKITTISDLEKLKYALDSVFDEIPNNIYIECPELFTYGKEQLGLNDEEVSDSIKCYGINIEKSIAKIY